MIKIDSLCKSFEKRNVLQDVSIEFEQGKTNLIIGRSGSGKTVLLKCLVGLLDIDAGEIFYDDRALTKLSIEDKRNLRKDIGMLFQGGALFDSMTVEENVIFPLSMFTNMTLEEKKDRANFCLSRVKLDNAHKLLPSEISGGMKKRVAIARAIAPNPKYLFCDEPNSGLDPQTSIVIDQLIYDLTKELNITTVIVTHDMNSVVEIGEKIAFIYNGQLWWEGTNDTVLTAKNKEIEDFIYASELMRKLKAK